MRSCYVRFLSPIRKHHDRVVMLKLAFSTHFINKTKRDRKQHDSRGGVTRPRPPSFSLCCTIAPFTHYARITHCFICRRRGMGDATLQYTLKNWKYSKCMRLPCLMQTSSFREVERRISTLDLSIKPGVCCVLLLCRSVSYP